jgi:hypothetical protein
MSYTKLGSGTVTLSTGDVEIGAVEVKNASTDDRAAVKTASTVADTDKALAVADPNLDAKVPALGVAASAASSPVVLASDDAHLGAVGAAPDADGVFHAQFYYLNGKVDLLNSRVAQPSMADAPSTISIDTSSAAVTGLTVGTKYMVYCTAPCFIEVGPDAVAAELTDTYIEPGMVFVWTPTANDTDDGIAAIASVAGGTVYVQPCQA